MGNKGCTCNAYHDVELAHDLKKLGLALLSSYRKSYLMNRALHRVLVKKGIIEKGELRQAAEELEAKSSALKQMSELIDEFVNELEGVKGEEVLDGDK